MDPTVRRERRIGIDEYAALPDDGSRTELVHGRVLREPQPSWEHGRLQARLIQRLSNHIAAHAPDLVCTGPFGVVTDETAPTVRGPDVSVLHAERARALRGGGFLRGAPDLAVEIVSPSNTAEEIHQKVDDYFRAGARLVWVLYPGRRTVAVHPSAAEARFLTEDAVLDGCDVLPDLRLDLSELFGG